MKCPFCNVPDSKVVDSRTVENSTMIRRRRECVECGKRFTTYEKMEELPIVVIKKDGSIQTFDKNKLLNGLLKACEKRPVSTEDLTKLADDIENKISTQMQREVKSTQIGEYVMDGLKELDEVAYVRFASVYRQFKDASTFVEEIKKLLNQ